MTSIAEPPAGPDGFVRKKWTVRECHRMTETGLLAPGKYELIEGEVISKMGQGRLHIAVVTRIIAVLTALFGNESVQNQAQVGIGEVDEFNDPEPDVAVLRGSVLDYLDREPDPATEVLLVVEAANTSLPGDTTTKARIYARHGLPDYWVVSIPRRELIVFRQPGPDGYVETHVISETDSIAPLAAPGSPINVADLLP
jgi:Uma2 family endonuclease